MRVGAFPLPSPNILMECDKDMAQLIFDLDEGVIYTIKDKQTKLEFY